MKSGRENKNIQIVYKISDEANERIEYYRKKLNMKKGELCRYLTMEGILKLEKEYPMEKETKIQSKGEE